MRFNKVKLVYLYSVVSLLSPLTGAYGQSAVTVPADKTHMYSALSKAIGTFQTSLNSRPQTASATPFASKLDSADASNGTGMLQTAGMQKVVQQLSRYQQLGVQGVVIHTAFPIMTQEYFAANPSAGTLQQWSAFYKQVFYLCHQAGMKVMVESHPLYPNDAFSLQTTSYTRALKASEFQGQMAENNANIAAQGPDFISIVNEPNTDFAWSHQTVYDSPTALASLVQASANAITTASPETVAAAGAPNWQKDAQKFDSLFYQIATLGAIDIHIYFSGDNGLEYATTLADNARAASKQVVVSESWLSKTGDGIPPSRPVPNQAEIERAAATYTYWQPLDAQFIYSFFKWANVEQPTFFTFFFSQLLFANLPYSQVHSLSDTQIIQEEKQAEAQAISADQFTSVGLYYSKMLTAPRLNQY
jgi:hypothetical protein